jgi:hypothetical protein
MVITCVGEGGIFLSSFHKDTTAGSGHSWSEGRISPKETVDLQSGKPWPSSIVLYHLALDHVNLCRAWVALC